MSDTPTTASSAYNSPRATNPTPTNPALKQWIFSEEEIVNCPSSLRMTQADINEVRLNGCGFIMDLGKALETNAETVSLGCVYFQRFFQRKSFTDHDYRDICSAALFLAAKVNEEFRYPQDVLAYAHYYRNRKDATFHREREKLSKFWEERNNIINREAIGHFMRTEDYHLLKRSLVKYELELLYVLCYDVYFDTGHRMLSLLLKKFDERLNERLKSGELTQEAFADEKEKARSFWKLAYTLLNDMNKTPLALGYQGPQLADVALFMASGSTGEPLDKYYQREAVTPQQEELRTTISIYILDEINKGKQQMQVRSSPEQPIHKKLSRAEYQMQQSAQNSPEPQVQKKISRGEYKSRQAAAAASATTSAATTPLAAPPAPPGPSGASSVGASTPLTEPPPLTTEAPPPTKKVVLETEGLPAASAAQSVVAMSPPNSPPRVPPRSNGCANGINVPVSSSASMSPKQELAASSLDEEGELLS